MVDDSNTVQLQPPNTHSEDYSSDESEEEKASNESNNEIRHGPGRPKLLKTGRHDRPRKIYQPNNTTNQSSNCF